MIKRGFGLVDECYEKDVNDNSKVGGFYIRRFWGFKEIQEKRKRYDFVFTRIKLV